MYKKIALISFLLRSYYTQSVGAGLPFEWQLVAEMIFPAIIVVFVELLFRDWPSAANHSCSY